MLNANITIKGIEDKGLTFIVKDEKGDKFTVWKNKKNGEPTEAFLGMPKYGETTGISYKEEDKSFVNGEGKTINFKQRTILSFLPPISNIATPTPTQAQKTPPQPKYEPTNDSTRPDWNEINIGKCQFGFLAAYIQSGKTISEAKLQVVPARQLAELVVQGTQTTKETEPLPEEPAEVDPADIPF